MATDDELLRAYATERSETAFRELVQRHVAVVHGVARRRVGGDAQLADDVAQRVFIALARKAPTLLGQSALVGWLFLAARFEAARVVRTETRRRQREAKAGDMNDQNDSSAELPWEELQPVLDEALAELAAAERDAVLLRYFSGRSFAEVGQAFAITEDAARKRVERAIEKLRAGLARRGLVSSASALTVSLSAHAASPVAPAVSAAIATAAWAQAPAASTLAIGVFMSSTKTIVAVASAVLLLAGTLAWRDAAAVRVADANQSGAEAMLTRERRETARLDRELAGVRERIARVPAPTPPKPVATAAPARAYLLDPEYRTVARTASQARRHLEFQRLYHQLGLQPAQIERFEVAMTQQDEANLDAQIARDQGRDPQEIFRRSGPEWSAAMHEILGDEGFATLQVYLRSMALRNFVDGIAARTFETGEPISVEQSDRILALALANDSTFQSGKGTDPSKVNWNAVWDPSAAFLSAAQLATLETAVEVWSLQRRVSAAQNASTPSR